MTTDADTVDARPPPASLAVPPYVPVRLSRLGSLFDVATGLGSSVGQLSTLMGEELLIELAADWLARAGRSPVLRLDEKPIRDETRFVPHTEIPKPSVRDLDGWLRQGNRLFPVEAKMRTAASLGQVSRRLDETSRARERWRRLAREMTADGWTQDNKVLLPLRKPAAAPRAVVKRPIYAVWWPVSNTEPLTHSGTMQGKGYDGGPATVTVLSGSLYVRHLLRENPDATLHLRGLSLRTTVALLEDLGCAAAARPPAPPRRDPRSHGC